MKELDYLMNLRQVEDRFYQNYGDFTIDTQEPPVDMCHLISATKEDGHLLPDGFYYCINAAADYVMSYLIDDTGMFDDGMNDRGISLRRLLAHVNYRTVALARIHGASRAYHIIGVSSAEIPLTQFFTYLAAGFMGRFSQLVGREKAVAQITKKRVNEWANKLNLNMAVQKAGGSDPYTVLTEAAGELTEALKGIGLAGAQADTATAVFAGEERPCLKVTGIANGRTMCILCTALEAWDYIAVITASAPSEEEAEGILACWYPLEER